MGNNRILIIHPHLHILGGSEKLTKILIYELASMDNEVLVLTSIRNEQEFPETKNVKYKLIKDINVKAKSESINKIINIVYTVDEVLSEFNPDVTLVMIQEPVYSIALKLAKPELGNAMYIHYPFEEELTPENLKIFLKLYRFPNMYLDFYGVADLHMTNSNYTARALYKKFHIESNVVYPAVSWDYFKERIDLESKRDNIIVSVGRFVPQKRHHILLDWFKKIIKPRIPDAKLVIIGLPDARYKDYYEMLRRRVPEIRDVEFIDKPLSDKEIAKYYREAKVYIHLRIGEHFGMAPVEAMSQGAVPVLPKLSGLAELITQGRDGFTYETDKEAAEYTVKILSLPPEEIVKMRTAAYMKAWYFNPDRFAKQILNYLRILV